ncbi:sulfurtransferase TusA family protein [Thiomicrospira sp. WB1]|uniref:sulfurtransferase TusA family protein n=1 Tax=Thiomicrospira sp. WB1 TaxID=1685380 RepID=UPI00074A4AAA|nr:sulfurtransferase TusA family protein [Thiomicrospira sp. WB1]KUJ72590.1 hypothetical protein AVO41_01945 [Thiomicrospira sp. WB1]
MTPTDNTDQNANPLFVDARGLKCPMPVIKLQQAIRQLKNGSEIASKTSRDTCQIIMACTDAGAPKDIESWCRVNRHTFLGCEPADDGYQCRIEVTL